MAEALEIRIAHLEGAYEQFDKRLASVEARLTSLEAEVRSSRTELVGRIDALQNRMENRIDALRSGLETRMDSHLRWILGFQSATLLSLICTLLAVFLKR